MVWEGPSCSGHHRDEDSDVLEELKQHSTQQLQSGGWGCRVGDSEEEMAALVMTSTCNNPLPLTLNPISLHFCPS